MYHHLDTISAMCIYCVNDIIYFLNQSWYFIKHLPFLLFFFMEERKTTKKRN